MEGHLLMSAKERKRKSVFDRVLEGGLSLKAAAELLGLSYRQCRRSYKRFCEEGDRGLVHRSRGRRSNRAKPARLKRAVLARYRRRYPGFGPTYACEKLAEQGYHLCAESLRQWLLADGQWHKRRKRATHRQRRERKAHFGELVQMDGSHHRWFGPEAGQACLMNMVDDARGTTLALMAEEETTEAAMGLLWQWVERYGIPKALYTDKKTVFVTEREPTLEEQLAGEEPRTAFGTACAKLGIELITAHSPQAKGRVERKHGVYQDRLVKELRLRRMSTIAGANKLLGNGFVDQLNAKFEHVARSDEDFHRRVPQRMNLAEVFCFEHRRTVQNDWTVRYRNRHYQIAKENRPLPRPKDKVVVRVLLDATMQFIYRDKPLAFTAIAPPPPRANRTVAADAPPGPKTRARPQPKPAPTHPWRQGCTLMRAETAKSTK